MRYLGQRSSDRALYGMKQAVGVSRGGKMVAPLLRIESVTKSFEEADVHRLVLADLDLEVDLGEFVLIMGRSGSGKSTLLNVISGIDLPTRGGVYLGGSCLTDMDETARAKYRLRNIGFVFQFYNLIK